LKRPAKTNISIRRYSLKRFQEKYISGKEVMALRSLFVCSVVMVALLFSSDPAFAVRIKIATKAPANFKSAKIINKMFKEIEEKTDGNVKFKVYYGGVKGSGRDLLLKMKSGEIHGAELTAGEAESVSKDLGLMSTLFTFKDYNEVDHVFEMMSVHLKKQMEERGYVVLGWFEVGFAYIMSVEPIERRADLKNKKVWMPQEDHFDRAVFEAIGVPPIPMTIADVMLALQTGQIETVANSFVGAIALQWYTRIKYITDMPFLYAYGLLIITKDAYDKIPARYKKTVHTILDRYLKEFKLDIRKSNRESAQTLINRGIKFVPVTPENRKEFEQVVQEVKNQLLEKEFPGEGLTKLREYIDEYRKIHPDGE
jgi:TRAP-type C4-dicarboxylate transport system substrate-binding protein